MFNEEQQLWTNKLKDLIPQRAHIQKKRKMPQMMMEEYTTMVSGTRGLWWG